MTITLNTTIINAFATTSYHMRLEALRLLAPSPHHLRLEALRLLAPSRHVAATTPQVFRQALVFPMQVLLALSRVAPQLAYVLRVAPFLAGLAISRVAPQLAYILRVAPVSVSLPQGRTKFVWLDTQAMHNKQMRPSVSLPQGRTLLAYVLRVAPTLALLAVSGVAPHLAYILRVAPFLSVSLPQGRT